MTKRPDCIACPDSLGDYTVDDLAKDLGSALPQGSPPDEVEQLREALSGCLRRLDREQRAAGHPDATWRELERIWCEALVPEGPDVINRVTTRAIELRASVPQGSDPQVEQERENLLRLMASQSQFTAEAFAQAFVEVLADFEIAVQDAALRAGPPGREPTDDYLRAIYSDAHGLGEGSDADELEQSHIAGLKAVWQDAVSGGAATP